MSKNDYDSWMNSINFVKCKNENYQNNFEDEWDRLSNKLKKPENRLAEYWNVVEKDYNDFRKYKSIQNTYGHPSFDKTKESKYTYKSYYTIAGNTDGEIPGRPIGHTSYFSSSADGTLYYPKNHYIYSETVKTQLPNGVGYAGTQNVDPGFWPNVSIDRGDFSTASFYTTHIKDNNRLEVVNP